jgi:hypothetical protein
MTTFRQIEANRRNARKSTGPVTEEGKQRSQRPKPLVDDLPIAKTAREITLRYVGSVSVESCALRPSNHGKVGQSTQDLLGEFARVVPDGVQVDLRRFGALVGRV